MKATAPIILLNVLCQVTASGSAAKSPVEKVVELLEELKKNLASDQKVEQQIYDKYACWCETASSRKGNMINLGASKIVSLGQKVLELKGLVAVLSKEIADTSAKIAENEVAQKDSTAVRKKENGDWSSEKAELEEAINALERAIKVLAGAGTKPGLLQGGSTVSAAARKKAVESVLLALPAGANLDPKQFSAIQEFIQELQPEAPDSSFLDASSSYAPQSATVQGILKDQYDTFTANLESQTQTEAAKQRDFEDLISALVKELNHMNSVVAKKEEEKALAEKELADTVQELDDTKKQQDADIDFFDQMKAACLAKNEEWTARKEARIEEMKGIAEALKILTGDEARALFGKAIKPGMETMLLQLDSDSSAESRAAGKAYSALKAQARQSHSLRLASLAATIRSMGKGHFDSVIKEIDKMIQELKDEEADDIKQRDWCKEEYHKNSEEKSDLKWKIENNDATITKLESTIYSLMEDIQLTVEEIQTTKKQVEQMESERKTEHKEFKEAKNDDAMAIKLLEKTVEVLSAYHKKHKTGMGEIQGSVKLLQAPEFEVSEDQAPDATFADKGSRKNESKGIISILTMLIEDLHAEIKNGVKDEVAAQADFEKQLAAAKKLIEDLTAKKANLESDKADTEAKKADEEEDKASNAKNLESNEEYYHSIAPDCDWILNSFEERRGKRKAEMNGLVTAKEYLTGATLLQTSAHSPHTFDDNKLERIGFESLRR